MSCVCHVPARPDSPLAMLERLVTGPHAHVPTSLHPIHAHILKAHKQEITIQNKHLIEKEVFW